MSDGILVGTGLAQAIAMFISMIFVVYVLTTVVPYLRHKPFPIGDASDFDWHFFIPARDEAAVIGDTLDYLRSTLPEAHVWVIDDASLDDTLKIIQVRAAVDPRIHVVSRVLPEARTGKGDALNAAYLALNEHLFGQVDRTKIIVGVLDADGLPAADCLEVIAADHLFGKDEVGAVQICVRMVNRNVRRPFPESGAMANVFGRTLVRMQDLEFRAPLSGIQIIRQRTKTVGLGGNGQFARLSALDTVAGDDSRPWHGSLLEDYELSLHLLIAGHKSEFTMDTLVDQEGLPSLRRLLTQRTRWGQGTMMCAAYLPRIWASPNVTTIGALEVSYHMIQPWLLLLGTVLYPIPIIILVHDFYYYPEAMSQFMVNGGWTLLIVVLSLALAPFVMWGPLYARRCEPEIGKVRAVLFGFAYSLFIFLYWTTCWRALYRIVSGRRGWAKTRRNVDVQSGPVALEA